MKIRIMSLTAYLTTERRVVRVRTHVVSEMLFARILLAAGLAMMWGFSCVPHNMVHKVFFACKALLANITSMWSLTSVLANVIYHVFFSGKCLGTILASAIRRNCIKRRFSPCLFSFSSYHLQSLWKKLINERYNKSEIFNKIYLKKYI